MSARERVTLYTQLARACAGIKARRIYVRMVKHMFAITPHAHKHTRMRTHTHTHTHTGQRTDTADTQATFTEPAPRLHAARTHAKVSRNIYICTCT